MIYMTLAFKSVDSMPVNRLKSILLTFLLPVILKTNASGTYFRDL